MTESRHEAAWLRRLSNEADGTATALDARGHEEEAQLADALARALAKRAEQVAEQ